MSYLQDYKTWKFTVIDFFLYLFGQADEEPHCNRGSACILLPQFLNPVSRIIDTSVDEVRFSYRILLYGGSESNFIIFLCVSYTCQVS